MITSGYGRHLPGISSRMTVSPGSAVVCPDTPASKRLPSFQTPSTAPSALRVSSHIDVAARSKAWCRIDKPNDNAATVANPIL